MVPKRVKSFFILMAAVVIISSDVLVIAENTPQDESAESMGGGEDYEPTTPVADGGDTSLGYCCDGSIEDMTCLPYNTGWHPHYPFHCKGKVVWWERRKFCMGRCSSY